MTNEDGLINNRNKINKKIGQRIYGIAYKTENKINIHNFISLK